MSFTTLYPEALTSDLEGQALPRSANFSTVNNLPMTMLFVYETNQSRVHTSTTPFIGLSHTEPLFLCPDYPGPGTNCLGTAPTSQSLLKLFELAHLKSGYPASLFLSTEIIMKAFAPVSSFHCLRTDPGASHCGPHEVVCLLPLGAKLSFQWPPSPDGLALLYLPHVFY